MKATLTKRPKCLLGMAVYNDEVQLAGWAENTADHAVETVLNYIADTDVVPTTLKEKTDADDTSVKPIQGSALNIKYDGKVVALNSVY